MNLHPEALLNAFMDYHTHTKRHIKNRDKAVVSWRSNNGFVGRDRFYFTPSEGEMQGGFKNRHYVPALGCSWNFFLYTYHFLTVRPDSIAVFNDVRWPLPQRHIEFLVRGLWFKRWKPNKWTDSAVHVWWGVKHCKAVEGMEWNVDERRPVNPTPNKIYTVDFDNPAVQDIRRRITEVKQRYMPLARMHATTDPRKNNPFEGVVPVKRSYEQLIRETEVNTETYVWLVSSVQSWNFKPVMFLNSTLEIIKKEQYRKYLKEETA